MSDPLLIAVDARDRIHLLDPAVCLLTCPFASLSPYAPALLGVFSGRALAYARCNENSGISHMFYNEIHINVYSRCFHFDFFVILLQFKCFFLLFFVYF